MNLVRCKNGHYYDSDTYATCPHCSESAEDLNKTVSFAASAPDDLMATTDFGSIGANTAPVPNFTVSQDAVSEQPQYNADDVKTVSVFQKDSDAEEPVSPIVGWLVCTKGRFYGKDFPLRSGRNFIGRNADMDICLAGENTVSRDRHAIVIYEPRKNIFLAQPGESRELFYVNGNVVLSSTEIHKNDVLQIGDVSLMLIPCCDESFNWESEEQ